jgi:protein gp37
MAKRLKSMGQFNYRNGFELTLHEKVLQAPLTWKKPQIIFVNSMSDLFHENIPFEFIEKVFKVMGEANWHVFQLLTKRSERLIKLDKFINWPSNVWMGVSVENENYKYRIKHLQSTSAYIKFLSLEPLLGPIINVYLASIDWVIVGGESGPGARPMSKEWVVDIKNSCISSGVPFFFKQWGGVFKKKNGRILENRTWDEMPLKFDPIRFSA